MGIVRLAKCLKLLNSLNEITDRKTDLSNKIDGNRVYMDFISIAYKVREFVINDLNYLLFNFLLIENKIIDKNYEREKFENISKKYDIDITQEINNLFIENYCKKVETNIYKYIYNEIVFFVSDMLKNKLVNVEYVLISFDGVPSYAKIQEQRHRRYMRYAFVEFKKYINNKETRKHKLIDIRKIYDEKIISCDIKKTTDYVYKMYHENNLANDIKNSIEKIIEVVIIDKEFGEGEKILMEMLLEDFKKYKNSKSYVFYSPDGDSVLLCLKIYINTKAEKLNVVKAYSLQPSTLSNTESQYIDVKFLYNNIIDKIIEFSPKKEINDSEKDLIISDFIILMSFYGNDFIFNIPTMEIEMTTIDMIYLYSKFLFSNNKYITQIYNKKTIINYKNLIELFKVFSEHEHYLLLDTFLADKQAKNKIISSFGRVFPMRYFCDYQEIIKKEKDYLLKQIIENNMIFDTTKNLLLEIVEKLKKIKTITNFNYGDIFMKTEIKNINNYINKLLQNKSFDEIFYNLFPRKNKNEKDLFKMVQETEVDLFNLKPSKNNDFDYQQIRKMCNPHSLMPTTMNDIDLYLLDWKGGKWKKILNAKSPEFGYDCFNNKIKNFEEDKQIYTNDFLETKNIDKISKKYLKTLSWVIDYYFNEYDLENKSSTWCYKYDRSPFFYHIYNYCKNNDISFMNNVFEKSLIDTKKYINEKIYKLYIYPQYDLKIPKKYKKSFPNIREYIIKVMKTGKNNGLFDARLCPFFSKTFFKNKKLTYEELLNLEKNI